MTWSGSSAAITARTSLKPGSETSGVPASLTSTRALPASKLLQDAGPQFRRIVIMIGDEPCANAVALEQFPGDPRILAEYLVGCGQGVNRP